MPFNGNGAFTLTAGNPVVSGTVISATTHNNTMADIANNGLSNAITKDGQTTITQNIPFSSNRITGLGLATALTDAARVDQIQNSAFINLSSVAGTNTITATIIPVPSAYAAGQIFVFEPANDNTGAITINISSLGAKDVYFHGEALSGGELRSGEAVLIRYNGTQFDLIPNSPNVKQQSGSWMEYGGTANAITLSPSVGGPVTKYIDGAQYRFRAATTNTGATTIAIDGLAAIDCVTVTGVALPEGYIRTTADTVFRYDAGNNQMIVDREPEIQNSATGDYIRWANGFVEGFRKETFSEDITTPTGNIFSTNAISLRSYPVELVDVKSTSVDLRETASENIVWITSNSGNVSALVNWKSLRLCDSSSTTGVSGRLDYYVAGEWY